jgi:hypothetical protein
MIDLLFYNADNSFHREYLFDDTQPFRFYKHYFFFDCFHHRVYVRVYLKLLIAAAAGFFEKILSDLYD